MSYNRQFPRAPFPFAIEQLVVSKPGASNFDEHDEYLAAQCLDISEGGIGCESKTQIQPLTRLFVMFSLPDTDGKKRIRCEGYVAHSRLDGERCIFGVKFEEIQAEDRAAIAAWVASRVS